MDATVTFSGIPVSISTNEDGDVELIIIGEMSEPIYFSPQEAYILGRLLALAGAEARRKPTEGR